MKHFTRLSALGSLLLLAACGTQPETSATNQEGYYKIGQPYQIKGVWYYPHEDYTYDETGIASWYGADFHEQRTANGEIFNKNELTAAHKTLPLPTLARVTNLDNSRSIVVRINDRGPCSGARIMDVSERTAQLLGFEQQGTAKVRVQVLADESKAIADAMRHYGSVKPIMVASDDAPPVSTAPVAAVSVETLDPVQTTPEIHQQLVDTKPLPIVNQLPVTTANKIYVQAGAFTQLANANKLKAKLAKLGPVDVAKQIVNGSTFYRVRVGPIPSVAQADKILSKVRMAGATNPRTVVN